MGNATTPGPTSLVIHEGGRVENLDVAMADPVGVIADRIGYLPYLLDRVFLDNDGVILWVPGNGAYLGARYNRAASGMVSILFGYFAPLYGPVVVTGSIDDDPESEDEVAVDNLPGAAAERYRSMVERFASFG
ncbi:hypothetical protein GCM10023224_39280 [Streptomonospora halophila]|uniref:Uncharacterized protein n=1 Tax=Streptomonospora halophila TaxID=427369 RepID=A0ABP9GRF4_9ACTN